MTPEPNLPDDDDDDLRPEYDLHALVRSGVLGKYVARIAEGSKVVVLEPDVAVAFPSDEAVNEALRLVIQIAAIPTR